MRESFLISSLCLLLIFNTNFPIKTNLTRGCSARCDDKKFGRCNGKMDSEICLTKLDDGKYYVVCVDDEATERACYFYRLEVPYQVKTKKGKISYNYYAPDCNCYFN